MKTRKHLVVAGAGAAEVAEIATSLRVVQPLLEHPGPVQTYSAGTWGPPEAAALAPPRRWWYEPRAPHGELPSV